MRGDRLEPGTGGDPRDDRTQRANPGNRWHRARGAPASYCSPARSGSQGATTPAGIHGLARATAASMLSASAGPSVCRRMISPSSLDVAFAAFAVKSAPSQTHMPRRRAVRRAFARFRTCGGADRAAHGCQQPPFISTCLRKIQLSKALRSVHLRVAISRTRFGPV